MNTLRRFCVLGFALMTAHGIAQEMEIHEDGVVYAEAPPFESHYYDPYFNLDPTSSGTGGSTDPAGTGGSGGGSAGDIFEEQCGTSDAYLEANIVEMTGGGYTISNPEKGLWGNSFKFQAKIHNIGSSKVKEFQLKFTGNKDLLYTTYGVYPDLDGQYLTDANISTDTMARLSAQGKIECMNTLRVLSGNSGGDKKNIQMFHSQLRYRKSDEDLKWGAIQSVYTKDYCFAVERKFTHSYSIEASYEGSFELSPVASASLGLTQSYSYTDETVIKLDKFDSVHAYYQDYLKTVFIDAYRYQANGFPGGREDSTTYTERGRKFKVDYAKLEVCQ